MVNKQDKLVSAGELEDYFESKTSVKKQMHALHQLGQKLVALPDSQLKNIPLDEKLFDAIMLARKITKHGGLKRQIQYIGKLMRHVDAEPIESAINDIENGSQQDSDLFHLKEQWRDLLIKGDNDKLSEFFEQYPATDLQYLRQLVRNHKNGKNEDKKKHSARLIFKLVSELIDSK
ncbi:MAG: DUF615 domain-containing protein [Gammaproteobacteria bacterium]|nr:DUF615 domain-containing protein [Gammaproteobacteria bacterium]